MSVSDVLALPQVSPVGWGARVNYDSWPSAGPKDGVTVHYTGSKPTQGYLLSSTHSHCDDMIRGIERYHLDSRGWRGIGYNFIDCPHGILFRGRGAARGAHNPGDSDGDGLSDNIDAIGVLVLVGGDEQPTPASLQMLQRVCDSMGGYVAPHSLDRATGCPGDNLRAWVDDYNDGTLDLEDDMPKLVRKGSSPSVYQVVGDWLHPVTDPSRADVIAGTDWRDKVESLDEETFNLFKIASGDLSVTASGVTEAKVRTIARAQVNSHADNPDAHHE